MEDRTWEPDDWQAYINSLCRLRHTPKNFIEVPDLHCGDFGIESFTCDGWAYQCYVPLEPLTTGKRYENQRNKMTTDIRKFSVDNVSELTKLFGEKKISRWVLVTPKSTSGKLLQHATKCTDQVRAKQLAYVAPDFEVLVHTLNDFETEVAQLTLNNLRRVGIPTPEPAEAEIASWSAQNGHYMNNLIEKLNDVSNKKLNEDSGYVKDFARKFVHSEGVLNYFKNNFSEIYAELRKTIELRQESLRLESLITTGSAKELLAEQVRKLEASLRATAPSLDDEILQVVTWGRVGDWLLRCPLSFEDV